MNELSDDEIRAALDAAGRGPTDESRAHLRAALLDDDDSSVVPPRRGGAGQGRAAWWVAGTLAAAAAVLVAVVFATRDDDRVVAGDPTEAADPTDVVDDTSPASSVLEPAPGAESPIDSVVGKRWILESADGEPWIDATVPFFEPTISGTTFQADGSDGCNLLDLRGDVVDGRIVLTERLSTAMGCDDIVAAGPRGDEVFELDGQGRLVSTDGRLVYRAADTGARVGWGDLLGAWELWGWDPLITVTSSSVTIGTCAITPTDPTTLEFDGSLPFSAGCYGQDPPRAVEVLAQILSSGTGAAHLDGDTLLLVGSEAVVQLRKIDLASLPIDAVAGPRWILDRVGDEPWNGAVLPFFDITITGSTWTATGSGGCNEVALRGGVVDDALVIEEWESTAAACAGDDDVAPSTGRLRLDDSGRLVADDGDLTYVALDEAGVLSAPSDLIGNWLLEGWAPRISITASSATIGTCAVRLAPVAGGIRFDGWPSEPTDCLGSDAPYVASMLLDLVTEGPVTVQRSGDRLILFGGRGGVQAFRVDRIAERDRITIDAGAAFGLVPGAEASVDAELARIEGLLGPVSHDTGWYSVPVTDYGDGTSDCLGGRDYRVLWWGDLSLAFWRAGDVPESLWAWSVGDKRVSLWGDRREPYSPPADASSGLATEQGIAIGTPEAEVTTAYAGRLSKFDPSLEEFGGTVYDSSGYLWPFSPTGAGVGVSFLVRDGVVVGFGASLRFC